MASALKKFLKERPSVDDIDAAMLHLGKDGSRGSVVLGCALVEDVLRLALLQRCISLSSDQHDRLFIGGLAPLGAFSSKIRVAHAFGIIGPGVRDDLDHLRELRNAFAHSRFLISLETPEVKEELLKFNCITKLEGKENMHALVLFNAAIRILLLHLVSKFSTGRVDIPAEIRDLT
jgi:hypothetical protein